MIIFFYGEDTYRMRQKLKALKEKFISASLGDTNLSLLDGATISFDEFVRQILAMPFLTKSRLVIVENLLKNAKKSAQGGVLEKIPDSLKKVPNSTVLVFIEEGVPDRRTALFKRLSKEKTEEFKLLEPDQLRRWVARELEIRNLPAGKAGVKCEAGVISKLIDYVGADLWRMKNEIDKLTAYCHSDRREESPTNVGDANKLRDASQNAQHDIRTEDIELLVQPQIQSNIFNLIEAIANKNLKLSVKELYKLLNSGQNELYIFTMIVYEYRNLLILKDLTERGKVENQWTLAKKAGLHPFVVQKSLGTLKKYKFEDLKNAYKKILNFDIKIKTGKMESRTALELLIFELCK